MTAIGTMYCRFWSKTVRHDKSRASGRTCGPVSAGGLWGQSGLWHGSWPLRVTAVGNSSKSQLLSTQLCLENLSPELLLLQLINSPHSHYCFYDSFEDTVSAIHVMSIMLKMFLINAWLDIPAGYLLFGSATSPPALRLLWLSNTSCAKAFSLSWLPCRVSHLLQGESFNLIWKWDHPLLQALPHTSAMPSLLCTWPGAKSRLSAEHRAEQLKTPVFINSNLLTNQHHEIKKQGDFKLYSRPAWHVKLPEARMLVKMSISCHLCKGR